MVVSRTSPLFRARSLGPSGRGPPPLAARITTRLAPLGAGLGDAKKATRHQARSSYARPQSRQADMETGGAGTRSHHDGAGGSPFCATALSNRRRFAIASALRAAIG
ncbi:hypothetical protein AGDE_13750 [Angomonas deanei]|nr:hypothetical protein AGDE_13750 [Angomonas deanei]|eukprot:EPY21784.1 hypothetical protein AGDE_13750 [Angomonas deanei]